MQATRPVIGGTISINGSVLTANWDNGFDEHWTLPNNDWGHTQAEENFAAMVERGNEE